MTAKYFHELNYTMANEDTTVEFEMVKNGNYKSILTVGGSGSRSLPFLALPITALKIADVSLLQIKLIQFKLETIRQLSRKDALDFWIGENSERRKEILKKLKLDSDLRDFIDTQIELNGTTLPPLYWGKWEKTFLKFSRLAGLLFSERTRRNLFNASEPYEYFRKNIKGIKWTFILRLVGNSAIFNSLLYKGHFIKKNSKLSYFDYYEKAFDRLFSLEIRKSHFLQICFFGKVIHEEALPIEFRPDIFELIKSSTVKPEYVTGSIFEDSTESTYDFISLSDVPSYLGGELERNFLQIMKDKTNNYGTIISRYYLRRPEQMKTEGLRDVSEEYSDLVKSELVQMYDIHILRK